MKNSEIILAIDKNGDDITVGQVQTWLNNSNKNELIDLFFNRFYGKYLKPFDFPDSQYKKTYKNGFAIMTSCCLLIETFVSFSEPTFRDNNFKSERCFGFFFLKNIEFKSFTKDGLTIEQYKDLTRKPLKNKGIPYDFYKNVRCGLLHNGETRNGWKISRNGPLFDKNNKRINAVKFMAGLIDVIKNFQQDLHNSDIEQDLIWRTYKDRLNDLLKKS